MSWATRYEKSIRNLAETLVRSASAASYEDALENAKDAIRWFACGLRVGLIDNPDVSCEDFHEVLEIEPMTVFEMALDEYRAQKEE